MMHPEASTIELGKLSIVVRGGGESLGVGADLEVGVTNVFPWRLLTFSQTQLSATLWQQLESNHNRSVSNKETGKQ